MEQTYHELLIEALPEDLTARKVLLIGALPQTIAFVVTRGAEVTAYHFSFASFTQASNLNGVTNFFEDIALDTTHLTHTLFDYILFPITKRVC